MTRTEQLTYLIRYLAPDVALPDTDSEKFHLFRALVNVRPPQPAAADFLRVQDEFLQGEIAAKGVTSVHDMTPVRDNIYLWQGDITTLKADAIVNAANSGLTGCYYPCHSCIDNVIHTYAGVQLRLECAEIMQEQGHPEPTGQAKLTAAYDLPSRYVLHTVGPIIRGSVTETDEAQLASCYRSCLETAAQNGIGSIAFCCISTGEFHFPNKRAAEIAVETVTAFAKRSPGIRVIFNVFTDADLAIYKSILK